MDLGPAFADEYEVPAELPGLGADLAMTRMFVESDEEAPGSSSEHPPRRLLDETSYSPEDRERAHQFEQQAREGRNPEEAPWIAMASFDLEQRSLDARWEDCLTTDLTRREKVELHRWLGMTSNGG